PKDLEPRDDPGVPGRLALAIREIGWDGDHGLAHRHAEISLGIQSQFPQHGPRDLGDAEALAIELHPDVFVHPALDQLVGEVLSCSLNELRAEAPSDETFRAEDGSRGI